MAVQDRLEHFRRRYMALNPGWEHATARYQHRVSACVTPELRVLDLGCGRGGIVERLHTAGHWTGCDPDWASLAEHRLPTLPRAQALSECLPFGDAAFDIVTASWVLEHLANPAQTFAEIARVLRPGGRFFFITPNRRHPLPRLSLWLVRLEAVQRIFVAHAYRRAAADAFPVCYRANTFEEIAQTAAEVRLHVAHLEFIADPSYLAWNGLSFALAVSVETLLTATWKVHIVGEFVRL